MQSIFRLPWRADQFAPKMAGKPSLEGMRTNPVVELPVLNKLKRKRAGSGEVAASPRYVQSKKQRSDDRPKAATDHARLPIQSEREQSVAIGAPGNATPQSAPSEQTVPTLPIIQISAFSRPAVKDDSHNFTTPAAIQSPATTVLPTPAHVKMEDTQMEDVDDATDVLGLTPLQQAIENQFNLQILMKHNELRLIDQELAKCQVALEQLRRCELRPYPSTEGLSLSVSQGIGPAVTPPPGTARPPHPAPYGVTDGPYTRHYRQWLLLDSQFDATSPHYQMRMDGITPATARSTRTSGSARKSGHNLSSTPGRHADGLHSLPNYPPPPPKDKNAPLVLRRSTDNQLVKLVCNSCHRGDFCSIQGFLNHCRIAHKVDYKSHDAAAIDCGHLLDEHDLAMLPREPQSAVVAKASGTRKSSSAPQPTKKLGDVTKVGSSAASPARFERQSAAGASPVASATHTTQLQARASASSVKASTDVPRLSAFLAKCRPKTDLAQALARLDEPIEPDVDEDLDSPATAASTMPSTPVGPGKRTIAGPLRFSADGSPEANVFRGYAQHHRPAPIVPSLANATLSLAPAERVEIPDSPQGPSPNLSPHTADSNPGLVSDHEDDDHASASEDEAPHHAAMSPPLGVSRDCSENVDVSMVEGEDRVLIRRSSVFGSEDHEMHVSGSSSRDVGGLDRRGKQ